MITRDSFFVGVVLSIVVVTLIGTDYMKAIQNSNASKMCSESFYEVFMGHVEEQCNAYSNCLKIYTESDATDFQSKMSCAALLPDPSVIREMANKTKVSLYQKYKCFEHDIYIQNNYAY
jgi:type III secretory pathway component EscR